MFFFSCRFSDDGIRFGWGQCACLIVIRMYDVGCFCWFGRRYLLIGGAVPDGRNVLCASDEQFCRRSNSASACHECPRRVRLLHRSVGRGRWVAIVTRAGCWARSASKQHAGSPLRTRNANMCRRTHACTHVVRSLPCAEYLDGTERCLGAKSHLLPLFPTSGNCV